jgi:hypothetical protein
MAECEGLKRGEEKRERHDEGNGNRGENHGEKRKR